MYRGCGAVEDGQEATNHSPYLRGKLLRKDPQKQDSFRIVNTVSVLNLISLKAIKSRVDRLFLLRCRMVTVFGK